MRLTLYILAAVFLVGAVFTAPNYFGSQETEDFKAATYTIEGKAVQLDGSGSAVPNSVSYFGNLAKGDLNGDGIPDLAFLVTMDGGGSGTFYYVVAALQSADNSYVGTNGFLLGDRVSPQTTEIRDGSIVVNYADREANEPMTAPPSVGVSRRFVVERGALVEIVSYESERYGLAVSVPGSYVLSEHDAPGSSLREHHTITLIERDNLPLPEAGEGPPAITIDIYQNNLDSLSAETWIKNSSQSNFKLSPEGRLATTTVGGEEALSYRWSGLYEGTTVVVAKPDWIYAFTVTYLSPGDQIVQDFVRMRESIRFR